MIGAVDQVVPRTHSGAQARTAAAFDLLDMEDAVRGSREMCDAVYMLVERVAVHGSTERDIEALVRCASVAQDYATKALEQWEAARQAQIAA